MYRTYTWLPLALLAIVLACAGPASPPAPAPAEPAPTPGPAPQGRWELEEITLTFDPSVGLTPTEPSASGDLNMRALGAATLTGGATVEVRTWKPPLRDAPEDDPFGQTSEEARKSVAAFVRACREGATSHLVKELKDAEAGAVDELAVHGMMWDATDYAVLVHHLRSFRNPADLCAVAWVGTHGQEILFAPRLHVIAGGRAEERFVVIVDQDLAGSGLFDGLTGKPLREQMVQGATIAETVWEGPAAATVRRFVESLAVQGG